MPKLGLSNVKFKWNAISLMDEDTIVKIMGQLKAQGFDSETIIDYGKEHGLKLRQGAYISELPPLAGQPQIQRESAPSRAREGKHDEMTSNIDKLGVSEEGKEKLEEKKVM